LATASSTTDAEKITTDDPMASKKLFAAIYQNCEAAITAAVLDQNLKMLVVRILSSCLCNNL
jgi:hypothetical protein